MTSPRDAYIGIDVAFAKKKRLPLVVCVHVGDRLVPLQLSHNALPPPPQGRGNVATLDPAVVMQFVQEAVHYIGVICHHYNLRVRCIAIDAPSKPRAEHLHRRAAESALDKLGISCFTTPTLSEFGRIKEKAREHLVQGKPVSKLPNSNQLWMLVGFDLFRVLGEQYHCKEVYPQAIVRSLGTGKNYKATNLGFAEQLGALAAYTGWPRDADELAQFSRIGFGADHDVLDAYLSAWVASLGTNQLEAVGAVPDDAVWIPRVETNKQVPTTIADLISGFANKKKTFTENLPTRGRHNERPLTNTPDEVITDVTRLMVDDVVGRAVLCPLCRAKVFKSWPGGWDAHAAHSCNGLKKGGHQERKISYKAALQHLFR